MTRDVTAVGSKACIERGLIHTRSTEQSLIPEKKGSSVGPIIYRRERHGDDRADTQGEEPSRLTLPTFQKRHSWHP